ncbi:DUF2147 domain-containing protein [Natronospira bacteriovora]|uniref:DUF2147 domain-containing protein n=1 Tax=Natronospira bacteriovora TaxID=3069753 RepID=A0ABU0W321_9GAMM|nr:DUF2147 domain-containing protein [Natronospira sp. AB-CW4]MDQ2068412.1 DUF2147 domain-containing protein [Natronospira sp. AB-CW4]
MNNHLLALLMSLLLSGAAIADPVEGRWWTEDGEAIVEIRLLDEGLAGRIIWLLEPRHPESHERAGQPLLDVENPEPEIRERPVLGLRILEGFERRREGDWRGGEVYDPENGRTYRARLRAVDEGAGLNLRGYVGTPMLGRTSHWKRLEGDIPSDRGQGIDDHDGKGEQ